MKEPDHSCPEFDQAISHIEDARKINERLREWGTHWKDRHDEREAELEKEIDDLRSQVQQLEEEITELNEELKSVEKVGWEGQ